MSDGFRSGLVGVAGRPNVGKSTLVNALCGSHVSIVSDKPQTTRRRVAGVMNGDDWQLVLLDLPGFQTPRDGLTGRMQRTVDETLADVDAILFVLDGTEPPGRRRPLHRRARVRDEDAGRDRGQQDRPAQPGRHRRLDRAHRRAGRLRRPGAHLGQAPRRHRPHRRRAAPARAGGPGPVPGERHVRRPGAPAHRRAGAGGGAQPHARGGAARRRGADRGVHAGDEEARGAHHGQHPLRPRVAEGHPGRQERRHDPPDRRRREAGHRAPAGREGDARADASASAAAGATTTASSTSWADLAPGGSRARGTRVPRHITRGRPPGARSARLPCVFRGGGQTPISAQTGSDPRTEGARNAPSFLHDADRTRDMAAARGLVRRRRAGARGAAAACHRPGFRGRHRRLPARRRRGVRDADPDGRRRDARDARAARRPPDRGRAAAGARRAARRDRLLVHLRHRRRGSRRGAGEDRAPGGPACPSARPSRRP